MKNLDTEGKIIFCVSFIGMLVTCTWLVLKLGELL